MKNQLLKFSLVVLSMAFTLSAHARFITLMYEANSSTKPFSDEFEIGEFETAELVSYPAGINASGNPIFITKAGQTVAHTMIYRPSVAFALDPLVVQGPATIKLTSPKDSNAFCTFRITPEAFPPDRTLIALPGTNQTAVTLECSTNLVQWLPATNRVYGPMPEAKFFRIRADRIP